MVALVERRPRLTTETFQPLRVGQQLPFGAKRFVLSSDEMGAVELAQLERGELPAGIGVRRTSAKRVERIKNAMRADQVAQLAIALCADAAKDVSRQVFAVRGNEVFLFNQPRPVRALARLEGWTPETLIDHALPALKASFTDIGASASVFPYDPI